MTGRNDWMEEEKTYLCIVKSLREEICLTIKKRLIMKKLFIISAAVLALGFIACSRHKQSRNASQCCSEMKDKAEGSAKDVGKSIKQGAAMAADTVKEKAAEIKENVKDKASEAGAAVKEKAAVVKEKASEAGAAVKEKASEAGSVVKEKVGKAKEKAADVLESGEKKLRE